MGVQYTTLIKTILQRNQTLDGGLVRTSNLRNIFLKKDTTTSIGALYEVTETLH